MFVLDVSRFDGGINLAATPFQIGENQSPDCLNTLSDELGPPTRRNGYLRLLDDGLDTKPVTGLYRYCRSNGGTDWLAVCGTNLYRITDDETTTVVYDKMTNGENVSFATFKDAALVTGKGSGLVKWDGSTASVISGAPMCDKIAVHHSRVFMAGNTSAASRLYWSDPGAETEWQVNSYIDFDQDDGEVIVGLVPLHGALYVFKSRSLHVLHGSSEDDFYRQRLYTLPLVHGGSILPADNGVYFVCVDGVKFFDGATVQSISRPVDPLLRKAGNRDSIRCAKYKHYLWVAYSSPGSSYNDSVLCFDTQRLAWWPFSQIYAKCFALADGIGDGGELYWGSSKSDGLIQRGDFGNSDDGASIPMHWSSKYFDAGMPAMIKGFRQMSIDFLGNGAVVTVDYEVDRGAASGTTKLTGAPGDTWGNFVWGEGTWTAAVDMTTKTSLSASLKGRYIRFIIRHTDTNPPAKIYRIQTLAEQIRPA